MRKVFIVLFLFLFCFSFSFASLIDIYKSGEIKLIPDPEFGKQTDWGVYLNRSKIITVARDGSIFVIDIRRSIVSKFDKKGVFLFNFGKKGKGPGCLDRPGNISLLNEKYLLIVDYPLNQKISLFDVNGTFIKVIKTNYPIYDCKGLKDNRAAILSKRWIRGRSNSVVVSILNINNSEEKIVAKEVDRIRMIREPNLFIPAPNLKNNGFIRKLHNGNLLVGFAYNDFLSIYTHEGQKVKTVRLKINKIEVTDKIVDDYKKNYINTAKQLKWGLSKNFLKNFKSSRAIKKLFSAYLPLYSNIFVDSEGNILVFYFTNNNFEKSPKFQVYSKEGNYICESAINFMEYEPIYINNRFKGFVFNGNSLYMALNINNFDVVAKIDLR